MVGLLRSKAAVARIEDVLDGLGRVADEHVLGENPGADEIVLERSPRRGRGEIVLMGSLALREAVMAQGIKVVVACPGYVTTPLLARHHGARPGEVTAEFAAARIVQGLDRNRAMIGFPFGLFWLSRIALLAPEALRRLVMRFFRFHMDS